MTSEELATARVSSTVKEICESENIQSRVDDPAPDIVHDSGSCEEGEIGSETSLVARRILPMLMLTPVNLSL
jgi:hypothetical protein